VSDDVAASHPSEDGAVRRTLTHLAQGLAMGSADVVPGVSGGTVALVVGIYERLIHSVRAGASGIFHAVRLDFAGARRRFGEVEWGLVLPLGAGILVALYIGSRFVPHLLETYPVQVRALFFGLILGSLVIPLRRMRHINGTELVIMAVAAVAAYFLVGLPPREIADPPLLIVFPFAAIAICAMILPGISGAFLLLVLGIYEPTLEALSGLNLPYIAVFVAGAAVGLGLFSKVLEWLLEHHHEWTMAALVGLMVGSLRALWPWLAEDRGILGPPDADSLAVAGLLALIGAAVVLGAAWATREHHAHGAAPRGL
jgi:putative membrane protein